MRTAPSDIEASPGPPAPAGNDGLAPAARAPAGTKPYESPKLIVYGTVNEITQFLPLHRHHHRWMSDS